MTIFDVLKNAVVQLKAYKIDEPVVNARIVLADLMNMRKEELIINEQMKLDDSVVKEYFKRVDMLCENIPVQYITKKQEFMGEIFEVNENVLIPRCDTEILVEEALKCLSLLNEKRFKDR